MKYIQEWWSYLTPYLGVGGLGLGAALSAAYLFGMLPIIGAVLQFISAVASPIITALIQGVVWLWQNIFWPGLLNIFKSLVTIITVCTIVGAMFLYTKVNDDIRFNNLQRVTNQCMIDLKTAKKTMRPVPQQQLWQFKFPWEL